MRFFCQTCPYLFQINDKVEKKVPLQRKQVDDVLGGDEAWENVDQTESACSSCSMSWRSSSLAAMDANGRPAAHSSARCPHCEHTKAYFMQIQIRSADEPSTTFYKCVQCKKQWND
jgi:DNA-directed RNA polymerase III subunit RPC11